MVLAKEGGGPYQHNHAYMSCLMGTEEDSLFFFFFSMFFSFLTYTTTTRRALTALKACLIEHEHLFESYLLY